MDDNVFTVKLIVTTAIAAGTAIWGWLGWLIVMWVITMALDYLSGTLAAIKRHEWSSDMAREGLWHKGGMVLVVMVSAMTDFVMSLLLRSGIINLPFDKITIITVLALSWYTITELGSILENATKLTDAVPWWLKRFLKVAAEAVDAAGGKAAGATEEEGDQDGA